MQQGHLISRHNRDSLCLQIEQLQTVSCFPLVVAVLSTSFAEEELMYAIRLRLCSLDLVLTYNQYVNNDMPIVMSIRLNNTERNVSKITPKMSMAIPRTRIQRSGGDILLFVCLSLSLLLLLLFLLPPPDSMGLFLPLESVLLLLLLLNLV
jgi:hypothetical protein